MSNTRKQHVLKSKHNRTWKKRNKKGLTRKMRRNANKKVRRNNRTRKGGNRDYMDRWSRGYKPSSNRLPILPAKGSSSDFRRNLLHEGKTVGPGQSDEYKRRMAALLKTPENEVSNIGTDEPSRSARVERMKAADPPLPPLQPVTLPAVPKLSDANIKLRVEETPKKLDITGPSVSLSDIKSVKKDVPRLSLPEDPRVNDVVASGSGGSSVIGSIDDEIDGPMGTARVDPIETSSMPIVDTDEESEESEGDEPFISSPTSSKLTVGAATATDTINRLEEEQRSKREEMERKQEEQQERETRNQQRSIFIKQIQDIKTQIQTKYDDLTDKREYFLNVNVEEFDDEFAEKFEDLRKQFMLQRDNIETSINKLTDFITTIRNTLEE